MKKPTAVFLALAMLLSLCACSLPEPGEETEPPRVSIEDLETEALPTESRDEEGNIIYEDHPERYGGVVNIVYSSFDDHWDVNAPGSSAGTLFWAKYVYEQALATGIDGKLYPLVCDYRYDEENFKWMELTVREGKKFHDGTPVTIEDVLASYQRSPKGLPWQNVTDYEIRDGVLRLNFNENGCVATMFYWGYYTVDYVIMPKRICDKYPATDSDTIITDPKDVIGTGCYRVLAEETVKKEYMPLVRFEEYVPSEVSPDGNGLASPRRAYLDRINCIANSDGNNCMMHLMVGEYDVVGCDLQTYAETLKDLGYNMFRDTSGKMLSDNMTLIFNLHENSTSIVRDDVNLRKAILAAIDMDAAAFANYNTWYMNCHSGVLIDGYTTADFDNADFCGEQNLALAKEYLAKSNYHGETLVLRRPGTAGGAALMKIRENLRDAGINCEIDPVELSAYVTDYRDGTSGWDCYLLFGQGTTIWPGLMPVNNYVCWTSNKEATELRNKLFSYPTGTPESIALWEQYEKLMAEEVPVFCIAKSLGDRYVQAPGLHPNYQGFMNYMNAYWDDPSAHAAK